MVKQFSKDIQGEYGPNRRRLYFGVAILTLLFVYQVSNFSSSYNLENTGEFILFYFIVLLMIAVSVKIKKDFKLKLIIEKAAIRYTYTNNWKKIDLSEITRVAHEASNISIYCGDTQFNLPAFGDNKEYVLISEFKRLGIPCNEYVTD